MSGRIVEINHRNVWLLENGAGAPLLYLEGELEASLSGQIITRLEAFVEMVDAGRKAL